MDRSLKRGTGWVFATPALPDPLALADSREIDHILALWARHDIAPVRAVVQRSPVSPKAGGVLLSNSVVGLDLYLRNISILIE